MRLRRPRSAAIDVMASVGSVELSNPIMTASGTAGHGAELAAYFDLNDLGAMVVKSLSAEPWGGNPSPRVAEVPDGMLNAVGLANPGVTSWMETGLPQLEAAGATVVGSIWGRTVDEFTAAGTLLAPVTSRLAALEINVSCPNLESSSEMFAHSPEATTAVVRAVAEAAGDIPIWVKLSPNTDRLVDVAGAAHDAGAHAVTLINTVLGLRIDPVSGRQALGNGGGGLSGPAIHPVAVRAVFDVHAAHPVLPIVGVGGVRSAEDAVELVLAGASAVQVGTATFADPRAPARIAAGIGHAVHRAGAVALRDLVGAAHHRPRLEAAP
ncbi:MAG TPA: dihydroorotate dehydrogenase [Acidimicrobiales bacterium]